jgi:type IV pilus assembly protein PilB
LALRYGYEFVSLDNFQLESELLKKVPVDLMFRYNFVPLSELPDGRIAIAIADPSQLMLVDEISLLLGRRLVIRVAAFAQIVKVLRKG